MGPIPITQDQDFQSDPEGHANQATTGTTTCGDTNNHPTPESQNQAHNIPLPQQENQQQQSNLDQVTPHQDESNSTSKNSISYDPPPVHCKDKPLLAAPKVTTLNEQDLQKSIGFLTTDILQHYQSCYWDNFHVSSIDKEPILNLGNVSTIDKRTFKWTVPLPKNYSNIAIGRDTQSNSLEFYHPLSKQTFSNPTYTLDPTLASGPIFNLQYDGGIFSTLTRMLLIWIVFPPINLVLLYIPNQSMKVTNSSNANL